MAKLSIRDEEFRKKALYGPIWPIIWKVCLPLSLFQAINQLFSIADTIMASAISSQAVSTVVYMVQLQHIVSAIGTGLSVGGSIIISRSYGKGDYDRVQIVLSTLIAMTFIAGCIVMISIPFIPSILHIAGTPESFIESGTSYFSLSIVSAVIAFFNTIYISIEKSRGNTQRIVFLNIMQISLKLILTAIFIYDMHGTIIHIAIATMISNSALFCFAVLSLLKSNDAFSFSFKAIKLRRNIVGPILKLSFPSMIEKIAFSAGKAEVNKMAASYGAEAVGAAGISNNMSGMLTGWQYGFMDGGTALLGQINGSGDKKRTISTYRRMQLIEITIGFLGVIIMHVLTFPIARLFCMANGVYNTGFHEMIVKTFGFELLGCLLLSLYYSATPIILATGRTKLILFINFCRVFVFRLPIIYCFSRFSDFDYSAVGLTVAISNALVGILAFLIGEYVVRDERRKTNTSNTVRI